MNSMVVFDAPEPLVSQGTRPTTTVAPQALLLLNSPQARSWARALANRIESDLKNKAPNPTALPTTRNSEPETPNFRGARVAVERGYQLALGRLPTRAEASSAAAFMEAGVKENSAAGKADAQTLALEDFCQALLGLNEFIYVH